MKLSHIAKTYGLSKDLVRAARRMLRQKLNNELVVAYVSAGEQSVERIARHPYPHEIVITGK